jgi:hypothetical protein
MILRISSDYFCKQQQPFDVCNGDLLCFCEEVTFQLCTYSYVCYQWCNQEITRLQKFLHYWLMFRLWYRAVLRQYV